MRVNRRNKKRKKRRVVSTSEHYRPRRKISALGINLLAARHEKGWSQEEMARQAGLGVNSIRYLELGRYCDPHLSTAIKLAKAVNVPLGQLVGIERPIPDDEDENEDILLQ